MNKRKFFFGKHKGEFILDVIENDIQYISWCLDNVNFLALNDIEMRAYRDKMASESLYSIDTAANNLKQYNSFG